MEADSVRNFGIESTLRLILGGFILLIVLFLAVLSFPVYIYRLIILRLASFNPSLGSPVSPLSCFFAGELFSSKHPRSNLIITLIFNGSLPFDQVRKRIEKNWIAATDLNKCPRYPQFRQYPCPWMGFYFWRQDPLFCIDNHVYSHSHLEDGSNDDVNPVSEADLQIFTEDLLNSYCPPKRSPWEVHYIDNYFDKSSEKKSVLFLKFHHSLADGFSILSVVIEGIFEESLNDFELPIPRYPTRSWKGLMLLPFRAFYQLSQVFSHMFIPSPWKITDKQKSWRQSLAKSELIPIAKIKEIKQAFGVGFTSVLVSAISAGAHYDFTRRKQWLPMPLRLPDAEPLCGSVLPVPHHPGGLTNHATMAKFSIPVDKYSNVIHRLQKCDEILEAARTSFIPSAMLLYQNFLGSQLTPVQAFIGKNINVATGLTNFPSVPRKVSLFNNELLTADFAAGALQGNAGVGFMVLSYADNIRLVVTAENAVMGKQEMEQLLTVMCAHINKLYLFASAKIQYNF